MALAVEPSSPLVLDRPTLEWTMDWLTPIERIHITDWAERYYEIPSGNWKTGPFRWENSPWMKEIVSRLDISDPVQDIVFVKPSQVGASTAGTIWAAYTIDQYPTNFLYVVGTLKMARAHMIQRMNKMLQSCAVIQDSLYPDGKKRGVNTSLEKEYAGGLFQAVGTRTPDGLRSMSTEFIDFDEVDTYEFDSGGEGDPIELAKDRSESFPHTRKHFYSSTPLQIETSRIWPMFLSGDRRRFYVPCARCEFYQYLKWSQVKWDNQDYTSARYECEQCGQAWSDGERIRSTQAGEWRAERERPLYAPTTYHLTGQMYAHHVDLRQLVLQWQEAQNRPEKLSHFSHTRLGEPSSDQSMYAWETDELMQRREEYVTDCPIGVQRITAGIDVQEDRIEMVVVGWGWEEEAWILGWHIFYGPTEQPEVWEDLADGISRPYQGEDGGHWIDALCIDQRYKEHEVAAFCRRRSDKHTHFLWPIKGAREDGTDSKQDIWPRKVEKNRQNKRRIELRQKAYYSINTFAAKQVIYSRCKFAPPGPARWHFPIWADKDFFDQFTSEHLVTQRSGTKTVRKWIVKDNRRNEVLDCMVYALAALRGLYTLNIRFTMPQEQVVASNVVHPSTQPSRHSEPPSAPPSPAPQNRQSSWQPRKFPMRRR